MTTNPTTPPRPQRHDPEVKAAAAKALAAYLIEDCPDTFAPHDEELERDLAKHLRYGIDSYELAQDLESDGWEINGAVVVALEDGTDSCYYNAYNAALLAWVSATSIRPQFNVGQRVCLLKDDPPSEGTITSINEARAEYVVKTPAFVARHGDVEGGVVVAYERVAAAQEVAA